jgi:phosphonate transport system ATP-binding protein
MPLLDIHDLTHTYRRGGPPVLQGINLTADRGEVIGLIGRSGAGKSTLLRCINGLLTPTGGELEVLGSQMPHLSNAARRLVRRRIGMIFQEFNLIDRLTVIKNVLVGRLGYTSTLRSALHLFPRADFELAYDCIEQVGLTGYEWTRVRDLSGGQKQRVAIARTIAQGSQIILGDEATANLDARTTDDIMRLLTGYAQSSGALLLLSVHNLDLARRYCKRIVALRGGKLVYDGPSDDISNQEMMEALEL